MTCAGHNQTVAVQHGHALGARNVGWRSRGVCSRLYSHACLIVTTMPRMYKICCIQTMHAYICIYIHICVSTGPEIELGAHYGLREWLDGKAQGGGLRLFIAASMSLFSVRIFAYVALYNLHEPRIPTCPCTSDFWSRAKVASWHASSTGYCKQFRG